MYSLLKENTFFLEMENNSLFMKNNFGNLKIGTPKSYALFTAFLPYLDGKHNIEAVLDGINNEKLKNFYRKFMEVLKEQKFVLSSATEIDLSGYGEDAKTAFFYCSDLNELEIVDDSTVTIHVASKNEEINHIFSSVFSDKYQVISSKTDENSYITLNIVRKDNVEQVVYIYKERNSDHITISSHAPEPKNVDEGIFGLPLHIIEILASILDIEVNLKIHKVPVDDFFNQDYLFDLRLLSGKHLVSEGV